MKRHLFIVAVLMAGASQAAHEEQSDYQLQRLMSPTPEQLRGEKTGKVMIYDGLTQKQVNHAMNEQFHRIENMMFVRTRVVDENGDEAVEEDGCDE